MQPLASRQRNFGTAVLSALGLKGFFQILGRSLADLEVNESTVTGVQVLALVCSVALFIWIARTAFVCASGLNWPTWTCWVTAIACGIIQWAAWIMYFVFRSQIKKRLAATPPAAA